MCDANDQMSDYRCPITLQIFQEPVVASDGNTYEKTAILNWFKTNNTSPITRAILDGKFHSNNIIVKKIKEHENKDQSLYMEKFQFDFKNWLNYFNKKYMIQLKFPFNKLFDDLLNDSEDNFSENRLFNGMIHTECKNSMCQKYNDSECRILLVLHNLTDFNILVKNIHEINSCKMPDRKILYEILIVSMPRYKNIVSWQKKLIALTSTLDSGLKYFFKTFVKHGGQKKICYLLDLLNPKTDFHIISFKMFRKYITNVETYNELLTIISEKYEYINPDFYKYTLHYVLHNMHLLRLGKTSDENLKVFCKLITTLQKKFSIKLDLNEPLFGSIINSFINSFHWHWGSDALYVKWQYDELKNLLSNVEVVSQILYTLKNIGIKWKGTDKEIYNIITLKCDQNDFDKIKLPLRDMFDTENHHIDKDKFQLIKNYLNII